MDQPALLLVAVDADTTARVAAALPDASLVAAPDVATATRLLEEARSATPPVAVLAVVALPDGSGADALAAARRLAPGAKRALVVRYEELPKVVRLAERGDVDALLHHDGPAEGFAAALRHLLGRRRPTPAALLAAVAIPTRPAASDRFGLAEAGALLESTAVRIAALPGAIVRAPAESHVEIVVPRDAENELRAVLRSSWGPPLKPAGEPVEAVLRDRPSVRAFGSLARGHELFARELAGEARVGEPAGRDEVAVALLPWRREPRITVVLAACADAPREIFHQLALNVHRAAVGAVSEWALPTRPAEVTGPGRVVAEYDWVVTDSYVGPDRRRRPTSFWNRYVLRGRRRRIPSRIAPLAERQYIDRALAFVRRYALAYFALAAVDTFFTLLSIGRRGLRELNPLLAPLVVEHPLVFLLLKTIVAALAFVAVARLQLLRIGRPLLGAAVAIYALLDLYWLWLLIRLSA